MSLNRRHILKSLGLLAALPVVGRGASAMGSPSPLPSAPPMPDRLTLPRELSAGARVGIACPASGVTKREIRDFTKLCDQLSIVPVLGRNVAKSDGYLSAPDTDRADELMEFVDDASIDAIVCARGGYGVMRILPMLDYTAISQANKLIMGFSDITALLVAVNQLSALVTFHGPVAVSSFDPFTVESLKTTLMPSTQDLSGATQAPSPATQSFTDKRLTTISEGLGRGRLTGGNLAMVVATLGTNYEIRTEGSILFLEEVNEEPYKIDRMLTQLWLAGKLQKCNGIALGNFKNCEAKGVSISGPSHSLQQVLEDRLKPLGIPVIYGLPFGHVKSKLTLPLGVEAELDATNRVLTVLGPAVTQQNNG